MSTIWHATVMPDYYENLAADYDWLFDDDALASGLAINHPATARLLKRTSHASTVLDAACGTGINAAALARRGYRVWAADPVLRTSTGCIQQPTAVGAVA